MAVTTPRNPFGAFAEGSMTSAAPMVGTRAPLPRTTTVELLGFPVTPTIWLVDGCTVELRRVLWTETGDVDATEPVALLATTCRPEMISTRTVSRWPGAAPDHANENPLTRPCAWTLPVTRVSQREPTRSCRTAFQRDREPSPCGVPASTVPPASTSLPTATKETDTRTPPLRAQAELAVSIVSTTKTNAIPDSARTQKARLAWR